MCILANHRPGKKHSSLFEQRQQTDLKHTVAVSIALCLREYHDKEAYYFFLLMNTNPSNSPDGYPKLTVGLR